MSYKIAGISVVDDNGGGSFTSFSTNALKFITSNFNFGETSGYASGGGQPSVTTIEKFPFATDSNGVGIGNLTIARWWASGNSSDVSGYTSGGVISSGAFSYYNGAIEKFSFASGGTATNIGNLLSTPGGPAGQSSFIHGYSSGGVDPSTTFSLVQRFSFATDDDTSIQIGDLTVARQTPAGQSSTVSGYTSAGYIPSGNLNIIDKFPFSADSNATDVGDLTVARLGAAGQSSDASGYTSGGNLVNTIDKFPFASDANATDVGDLTVARYYIAGQSSDVSGYSSGGFTYSPTPARFDTIDKFPFASNANATDVGDLSAQKERPAGHEV